MGYILRRNDNGAVEEVWKHVEERKQEKSEIEKEMIWINRECYKNDLSLWREHESSGSWELVGSTSSS